MSDEIANPPKETSPSKYKHIPKTLIPLIKEEYLKGGGSIREVAEKYNVSRRALEVRASREKWSGHQGQVIEKIVQNVKKREDQRSELLEKHEKRMIERMENRLDLVDKTYSQIGDLVEPVDLKTLVSTESTIDSVIRRNLGAQDRVDVTSGGKSIAENIVDSVKALYAYMDKNPSDRELDIEALQVEATRLED